jgi:hypothetical protein
MIALAAVLTASLAIGAPVTAGHAGDPSETLGPIVQADPVQGGWIQFSTPQGRQLERVSEAGQVTAVSVPPQLRGEARGTLELTPLRSGWIVAVNRVFPGGRPEETQCLEDGGTESCGQLAAAQRSPSGRWTPVQRLARSRGFGSSAVEAVESHGLIQLAWQLEDSALARPMSIAVARPGHPFGRARRVARLMRGEPEFQTLDVRAGKLYVLGEFGPRGDHAIERRLRSDGSLGPPRFLYSRLLYQQGESLPQRAGREAYVYEEFYPRGVSVYLARRSRGAPTYGRPQVISREGESGYALTQDGAGRILIALRRGRRDSQLITRTISSLGVLKPSETLETGPAEPEGGYTLRDALDDSGQALVLGNDGRGKVWAHASGPRCPHFTRQAISLPSLDQVPELFVGHLGVFHLVWEDTEAVVHTAAARVHCVANGRH